MSSEILKYGLLGQSLTHSFSKKYFSDKFNNQSINGVYLNYEINRIEDYKDLLESEELSGLNVTIPYKESIIPYLDELSEEALEISAINTIQFKNGKSIGHNTDAFGFQQMIKPFFKGHHERAMILGTGGASKAVAFVLERLGVDVINISRKPKGDKEFSYSDINENMIRHCEVIVNTTPVGMFPNINDLVEIPYQFLTEKNLVIDLIYNPKETLFLQKAKEKGALVLNGETMLVQQAEKAWEIWNR